MGSNLSWLNRHSADSINPLNQQAPSAASVPTSRRASVLSASSTGANAFSPPPTDDGEFHFASIWDILEARDDSATFDLTPPRSGVSPPIHVGSIIYVDPGDRRWGIRVMVVTDYEANGRYTCLALCRRDPGSSLSSLKDHWSVRSVPARGDRKNIRQPKELRITLSPCIQNVHEENSYSVGYQAKSKSENIFSLALLEGITIDMREICRVEQTVRYHLLGHVEEGSFLELRRTAAEAYCACMGQTLPQVQTPLPLHSLPQFRSSGFFADERDSRAQVHFENTAWNPERRNAEAWTGFEASTDRDNTDKPLRDLPQGARMKDSHFYHNMERITTPNQPNPERTGQSAKPTRESQSYSESSTWFHDVPTFHETIRPRRPQVHHQTSKEPELFYPLPRPPLANTYQPNNQRHSMPSASQKSYCTSKTQDPESPGEMSGLLPDYRNVRSTSRAELQGAMRRQSSAHRNTHRQKRTSQTRASKNRPEVIVHPSSSDRVSQPHNPRVNSRRSSRQYDDGTADLAWATANQQMHEERTERGRSHHESGRHEYRRHRHNRGERGEDDPNKKEKKSFLGLF